MIGFIRGMTVEILIVCRILISIHNQLTKMILYNQKWYPREKPRFNIIQGPESCLPYNTPIRPSMHRLKKPPYALVKN